MNFNKNGFDYIVSLGRNCEVSARIADYLKRPIDSYPFSWILFLDQASTDNVLKNVDVLVNDNFAYDDNTNRLFISNQLNVGVHSKKVIDNYKELNECKKNEYISESTAEIHERYTHLVHKWRKLLRSENSTLFIITIDKKYDLNDVEQIINNLIAYFDLNYVCKKYFLLAIFENNNQFNFVTEQKFSSQHVGFAKVREFANTLDVFNSGDQIGFISAIEYFNHYCDFENNILDFSTKENDKRININLNLYQKIVKENEKLRESFTFTKETNKLNVKYIDFGKYSNMLLAVWSDNTSENQNDLVWYEAIRFDNNTWVKSISLENHNISNLIKVHFYYVNEFGNREFVGGNNNIKIDRTNNLL